MQPIYRAYIGMNVDTHLCGNQHASARQVDLPACYALELTTAPARNAPLLCVYRVMNHHHAIAKVSLPTAQIVSIINQ